MNELMEAALGYAKREWHVIPLHSRTNDGRCSCGKSDCASPAKHPRTEHGLSDGTTDEKVIREWWKRWPLANVGVVTGAISGIVGLDLDGPNAAGLLKREGMILPKTGAVQTGKGYHGIYAHPGGQVPNGVKLLTDGNGSAVDLRGDGGYVVAPPSVHITGRTYRWVTEVAKLPVLPDGVRWLLEKRELGENHAPADPGWLDEVLQGVEKGKRNDAAARLSGYWLNVTDGNEEATRRALQPWNRLNRPPLSSREIETTLKSISRRHKREKQHEIQNDKNYTRLEVLDGGSWAEAVKDSPPREGIEAPLHTLDEVGGLVAGDLIVIAGRPGMGKSTVAWNILTDVCIKRKVSTVVFSTEMTRYDVARWVGARLEGTSVEGLPRRLPEHILEEFRNSPIRMIDAGTVTLEDIEAIVASSLGTRLVIVDHLTRVSTKRHENRNLEVGLIARGLKSIAKDKQCTVLALCQMNRTGDDHHQPKLSVLRESGEIEQEADAVIFHWTTEEDMTQRFLKMAVYLAKNRHGALRQVMVSWDKLYKQFVPYQEKTASPRTEPLPGRDFTEARVG